MATSKMHPDEVDTDVSLVERLIATQLPAWAGLSIRSVPSPGTDNALYRLGEELVVRLPRIHWAIGQAATEWEWLPKLAPSLPLAVPTPLARGAPAYGYPWEWAVYRWVEGESAVVAEGADLGPDTAAALGGFVAGLQRVDATGGPPPREHSAYRGEPLIRRDAATREAIAALGKKVDGAAAAAAWEEALAVPEWDGPPVWIHGDLQPGNLLVLSGKLHAVIDFGCLGVGDPACDAMAAWTVLSCRSRAAFRDRLPVDDATWARGRGWALSFGLIALPYYETTNPVLAGIARRTIAEVIAEREA